MGGNRVRHTKPAWMVLQVVHWGRIHCVKDLPCWCGASSLTVSGFYFIGDLLTILSASEDSRSLMGGSDIVHCVWVPLTGTTVAEF